MHKPQTFKPMRRQGGFTMVELAIVLAIAGIILAAVLKGTDMINKAKIERMTADLKGMAAMMFEHEKRVGRMPGDCNEDGIIGYTTFTADSSNNNSHTNPYNVAGDPDTAGRCATFGLAETDSNLVWSDLRKANIVDPSRTNINLTKHQLSDFVIVGSMTGGAAPSTYAVNAIVAYGLPLWMAKGIDVAIDGATRGAAAGDDLLGGGRGRIRLYSADGGPANPEGAAWPDETDDYQIVSIIYYFDTRMLPSST